MFCFLTLSVSVEATCAKNATFKMSNTFGHISSISANALFDLLLIE